MRSPKTIKRRKEILGNEQWIGGKVQQSKSWNRIRRSKLTYLGKGGITKGIIIRINKKNYWERRSITMTIGPKSINVESKEDWQKRRNDVFCIFYIILF